MFLQLKEIKYSENILKEKVNGVEIQTQKGKRKVQAKIQQEWIKTDPMRTRIKA